MTMWQFQSNLNRGELDAKLVGRIDLQAYYNGLSQATNCLPIPQGGMKKRPGTHHLGTALDNGRLENFSFSTEQNYLLVFTPLRVQIYKDGILQTNLNGSGFDYLVSPWDAAQLPDFDFIQSADTAIVVHPDIAPQLISRTSDTAWTIGTAPLVEVPQFDYRDALSPTPVDEVQDIRFTNVNEGDRYKLSLEGLLTEEIVYATPGTTGASTNETRIEDALIALINTGNSGVDAVWQSGDTFRITFSGDSANDWDLVSGTPVYTKSVNFEVLTTAVSDGTTREEDVWSDTRGWPQTATFHEARLWFGGSRSRVQTLWGSMVNDFFRFRAGRARDDEMVSVTLDTDQVNSIRAVYSNRSLQIFTSGGEFYIPESPIVPSDVAVQPQTKLGSKRVRPTSIEGVTLFVQRTGKALNQFVFVNEYQANQVRNVAVLAPHLIKDPIQLATSRGTEDTDANYIYILNADGTLTVFNTLAVEDVEGLTPWETEGNIKSVTVVDDTLYLLTERVINSATVYQIEREDDRLNTDAGIISTVNSDTLTGLDHLEGELVKVKADGAVQDDEVVTGGQITTSRVAVEIEAGLGYTPVIKTMPLNVNLKSGPNAARKKKIVRAALDLYESNGVIVNGQRIADKTIGQDQFDSPTPNTGIERMFLRGWSIDAAITITQNTPMNMTILSIGMEVAV